MSNRKLVIFTDIGETIVNESTEKYQDNTEKVLSADCIPGAKETYLKLYEEGYTIAMVADGLVESFHNTMTQNGLNHIFASKTISEEVGQSKPSALMFETAMKRTGLTDADKYRVIMVGNNLARDVIGANLYGIRSVHLAWSPRYRKDPECADEIPSYRIDRPEDLLPLAEELERQLNEENPT